MGYFAILGFIVFFVLLSINIGPFILAFTILHHMEGLFEYRYIYICSLLYIFLKWIVKTVVFGRITTNKYRYRSFLPFCAYYSFGQTLRLYVNETKFYIYGKFFLFMQIFLTIFNIFLNIIFYGALYIAAYNRRLNKLSYGLSFMSVQGFMYLLILLIAIYFVFLFIFNLYYGRSLIYFLKYICKVKNKFLLFFVFIAKILNLEIVPLLVCYFYFNKMKLKDID